MAKRKARAKATAGVVVEEILPQPEKSDDHYHVRYTFNDKTYEHNVRRSAIAEKAKDEASPLKPVWDALLVAIGD